MIYSMFDGFTLDVAIPDGFKDSSYHNDAMPSWTLELPNHARLVIYIDYADPAMREDDWYERFALCHYDSASNYQEIVRSDDWQDILVCLVQRDIATLMCRNIIPASVSSFAELHRYCDANMLGGLNDNMDVINAVQDRIDAWLKA